MRNYKGAFQRTGEISREPSQCAEWLETFAEKLAVNEQVAKRGGEEQDKPKKQVKTAKTAVEVARERQQQRQPSIYEMMSSIISGKKPKYSSVEEAVKDYQQRTGLAQFLESKAEGGKDELAGIAEQVVQAGDEDDATEPITEWGGIGPRAIKMLEEAPAKIRSGLKYEHNNDMDKAIQIWEVTEGEGPMVFDPYEGGSMEIPNGWYWSNLDEIQADNYDGGIKDILQGPFDTEEEAHQNAQAWWDEGEDEGEVKDEPESGKKSKKEKGEKKEDAWAKVIELFGDGDDDEPTPSGGSSSEQTLFEIPELEEAATDDEPELDEEAQLRWIADLIRRAPSGELEEDDLETLDALCIGSDSPRVCRIAKKVKNHLLEIGVWGEDEAAAMMDFPSEEEFEETWEGKGKREDTARKLQKRREHRERMRPFRPEPLVGPKFLSEEEWKEERKEDPLFDKARAVKRRERAEAPSFEEALARIRGRGKGESEESLVEIMEPEEEKAAADDSPENLDEFGFFDEQKAEAILNGSEEEQIEFLKRVLREEPGDIEDDDDIILTLLIHRGASEKVRRAAEKIEDMYGLDYPTEAEYLEEYTPREDYEPPESRQRMPLEWEDVEEKAAGYKPGPLQTLATLLRKKV